jgi:hypothetical protein
MNNREYKLLVDLDGVLVNFMGGVLPTMNEFVNRVSKNPSFYKIKYPKIYKVAKKAIAEMGGDLEAGNPGAPMVYEDVEKQTSKKKVRTLMYALISNNQSWWANLDWMPGGRELWSRVEEYQPIICTGPMGPNSKKGKRDWCRRELGIGDDRIIITHEKHEEVQRATAEGKTALLIDDLSKYVIPWRKAGGVAIHHDFQNLARTLEQLQDMGL